MMPCGVFDLSKPGARAIASPMGGGWVVPLDAAGIQALAEFFGEPATALAPLGGQKGYVVEPFQSAELAEHLRACNVAWEIG